MEKKKSDLIRVFVKGGFISPADLLKILEASRSMGNKYVVFGSRQDILFPYSPEALPQLESIFKHTNIGYELGSERTVHQNIVSSYSAVNVVETTHWVKEDTYHVIADSFEYLPKIKINIVDPMQSLIPLFNGELNFLASKDEHYWFLYLRDARKGNVLELWPRLVHSQDVSRLSKILEELKWKYNPFTVEELYTIVNSDYARINYRPITEKLKQPEAGFPYYEGLNAMLNNHYWLGLYWRNNEYDIDFMSAACRLCQQTNIGNINIIPWKAFIIKGIKAVDRLRWEKLMGKFGINLRHSSLELNWHLPVIDDVALELKRFLVRELDQQDISTHGLTFAIKTSHQSFPFTSVVIEQEKSDWRGDMFSIKYAKDFNPNSTTYYDYARHVYKEMIPALLIELSKLYFRQLHLEKETTEGETIGAAEKTTVAVYQCSNCLTIYDARYGDATAGVARGTSFESLPETYKCPVCESSKKEFVIVKGM